MLLISKEISDWLTKIIVGLGLTQLAKIPDYVKRLTWFVSHSVVEGHHEFNESIAFFLMTAFSICGFFMGYLMTRLFLQQAFDKSLVVDRLERQIQAEVRSAAQDDTSVGDIHSTYIVVSGIERALSIQRISKGVSDDIIRKQVSKLANDYDALRLSLPSGEDRTKSLERIAAQMKSLGFAVEPLLNELKVSASAGERLAAVTSLELNPQEDFLDWLVERIDVERPFVGYHAALALLACYSRIYASARSCARFDIANCFIRNKEPLSACM